eukprot:CAMPEP_0177347464 /NCGR_PEP_ID=MMETSP0368-20130122/29738_1 /TAXON_ID=447022 ORGANISM="Scrippsiella hangoei-like, Strain SHHI-4" /NCGR_SAMPLE_ID=MMETSP0368 /ASSEMBLY_ACC=CAM_ASM_000363 /LENGTH=146 /DNA_ID=CAMNT_0018809195 /DNA_START=122 /DNA_END=559 /DNA_ORIENTATION=-
MRRMEANILPAALETKPKDNLKTSASIVPRILEMLKFVFSVCNEFTVSCRISCSCEAACCIREASNVQESATSVSSSEAGTEEKRADSSKLHSATSMAASLRPGPSLASSSASSSEVVLGAPQVLHCDAELLCLRDACGGSVELLA